jgi:hypothetical protein
MILIFIYFCFNAFFFVYFKLLWLFAGALSLNRLLNSSFTKYCKCIIVVCSLLSKLCYNLNNMTEDLGNIRSKAEGPLPGHKLADLEKLLKAHERDETEEERQEVKAAEQELRAIKQKQDSNYSIEQEAHQAHPTSEFDNKKPSNIRSAEDIEQRQEAQKQLSAAEKKLKEKIELVLIQRNLQKLVNGKIGPAEMLSSLYSSAKTDEESGAKEEAPPVVQ